MNSLVTIVWGKGMSFVGIEIEPTELDISYSILWREFFIDIFYATHQIFWKTVVK